MAHPGSSRILAHCGRAFGRSLLALGLGGLLACGGGGGGGSTQTAPPPPPAADISGIWTATTGGITYHALVLPGTLAFRTLDSNVLEGSGTFTLSGATLGGSILVFPSAPYLAAGYPKQTGTVSGTASSTALTVTIAIPLGSFTNNLVLDSAASIPVQLADLAGTYTAAAGANTSSGLGGTFTLDAAGNLTGSDPGGTLQGTLTAAAAGLNAFHATFTYTPGTGSPQTYSGLAYLLPGSPVQVVLMTDNGALEFSGYFQKQ